MLNETIDTVISVISVSFICKSGGNSEQHKKKKTQYTCEAATAVKIASLPRITVTVGQVH